MIHPERRKENLKKIEEMDKLKPCPFCGNENPTIKMCKGRKFVNGLDQPIEQHKWYVWCPKCKSRGSVASGKVNLLGDLNYYLPRPIWQTTDKEIKNIAIKLWNYRIE